MKIENRNFIEAYTKMIAALEGVLASLDQDNDDELDQETVIENMIQRMKDKLEIVKGNANSGIGKRIDCIPDWKEEGGQMKRTEFFRYAQIAKLDFIGGVEVAKLKGWEEHQVYDRLEELPAPVYKSGMMILWNRADFGPYEHLNATLAQVLTVSEAAELMGVTDRHVRRLCEAKKIAARKSADGTWIVGKYGAMSYMKRMAD